MRFSRTLLGQHGPMKSDRQTKITDGVVNYFYQIYFQPNVSARLSTRHSAINGLGNSLKVRINFDLRQMAESKTYHAAGATSKQRTNNSNSEETRPPIPRASPLLIVPVYTGRSYPTVVVKNKQDHF